MIIIDATDLIVGRMATYVAKQALLGETVKIVNAEKAVISGRKENTYDKLLKKMAMGTPKKGPFIPRMPDRLLRRMIRGMVDYKKPRGKAAYKRILCYIGVPEEFKDNLVTVEGANKSKLPHLKYATLREVSKRLGAKIE